MFNLLRQVVCCGKKAHDEEQVGLEEGIIEDGPITSQPGSENPVRLQEMVSLLEHLGDMPKDFSLVQAYKDLQVKFERLPEIMESPVQGQVMAKFNVKDFEYLTKGNFGKVFRVRTEDERTFVLKVQIPKYGVASRLWDYWNLCRDEINMLRMLKHKNVMGLEGYGSFTCAEFFNLPVYTVMQCEDLEMSLDDLFQKVERFQHASQFTTAFNDLGSGLAYLHQKGIAHHDLKPQNIMVSNQPGQTKLYEMAKEDLQQQLQNFVFKIIDLGIAKNYSSQIQNERLVDVSEKQCRGTTMWMCPQKIAMESYNPFLSDVHALGLILLVSSVGVYDIHVVSQGNVIERNVRAKYGAELSTLNPNQQKVLFRMTETVEFARPLLSEIVPLRED